MKDLPENLRFGYAKLVLALADNDPKGAVESYRCLLSHGSISYYFHVFDFFKSLDVNIGHISLMIVCIII